MNRIYELENYIDNMRQEIECQLHEVYTTLREIDSIAEFSNMKDDDYAYICDLISIIYERLSKLENL